MYPKTIIIRHKRENKKKCSLRGLDTRPDMQFFRYPFKELPSLNSHIMLVMEGAPELSINDHHLGLLILDSTWNYLPKMVKAVEKVHTPILRVLPKHFKTAYPREQTDCIDPSRGLSSVEALYIAYRLLGRSTEGILDHYVWKEKFLSENFP